MEGLGLHLGRIWDALGRLLDALGRLLMAFWSLKSELFASMGPRWNPGRLLNRFGLNFGKVLDGFWQIVEGIWEDLGA